MQMSNPNNRAEAEDAHRSLNDRILQPSKSIQLCLHVSNQNLVQIQSRKTLLHTYPLIKVY